MRSLLVNYKSYVFYRDTYWLLLDSQKVDSVDSVHLDVAFSVGETFRPPSKWILQSLLTWMNEQASRRYILVWLSYTRHWRSPSLHLLPETNCFSLLPLFLQTAFFLFENRSFEWTPFFFFFLILPFPPLSRVCMNARQSYSYQVHLQVSPDHAVFVAVTHQGDCNCPCY